MKYILIILSLTFSLSSFAETDCSEKAIKAARTKFLEPFKKKEFQKALDILKPFTECYPKEEQDPDLYCWVKSDYGLALLKAGKAYECRSYLGGDMDPRSTCYGEEAKFAKAISANFDLCQKEIASLESKYTNTKCSMKLPAKTVASSKLPGAGDKCVAIVGTKYGHEFSWNELSDKDRDAGEEGAICPKVVVLENVKGKISEKELEQEGSDKPILGDTMTCCYLNVIKVQQKDAQTLIRLDTTFGLAQPCGGSGTARVEGSGNFELKDNKLKIIQDTSWATH